MNDKTMISDELKNLISEMRAGPQSGREYFALTLTMEENGQLNWATQSRFVRFKSRRPMVELRVPATVKPEIMLDLWRDLGQPGVVVTTEKHLYIYLNIGGNALIETTLARKKFHFFRGLREVRPKGVAGFASADDMPANAVDRVPSRTTRMRVLKRDDFRCRICGRRPVDHLDVELHVHHVRPWSDGGATLEDNLITLCGTCHGGLDPHFELRLFDLLGSGFEQFADWQRPYVDGVQRYREAVKMLRQTGSLPRPSVSPNLKRRRTAGKVLPAANQALDHD